MVLDLESPVDIGSNLNHGFCSLKLCDMVEKIYKVLVIFDVFGINQQGNLCNLYDLCIWVGWVHKVLFRLDSGKMWVSIWPQM